eukprot:COSAG03_NODE_4045_length_1708_cov_3.535736_1_plen_132_part_00
MFFRLALRIVLIAPVFATSPGGTAHLCEPSRRSRLRGTIRLQQQQGGVAGKTAIVSDFGRAPQFGRIWANGRMQPPERPSTWFGAPPTAWLSGRGPNRPPWHATPSATPSLVLLSALAFMAIFATFRVLRP